MRKCLKSVLGLVLFAAALADCAAVDQYSGRAVGYNLEAEDALDQGLLLNVVRAANRLPMQFTSVASIQGTASASGTASLSGPVGPHSNLTPKTAMLSGTVSGGPTFTVPVLDTQECDQRFAPYVCKNLFVLETGLVAAGSPLDRKRVHGLSRDLSICRHCVALPIVAYGA